MISSAAPSDLHTDFQFNVSRCHFECGHEIINKGRFVIKKLGKVKTSTTTISKNEEVYEMLIKQGRHSRISSCTTDELTSSKLEMRNQSDSRTTEIANLTQHERISNEMKKKVGRFVIREIQSKSQVPLEQMSPLNAVLNQNRSVLRRLSKLESIMHPHINSNVEDASYSNIIQAATNCIPNIQVSAADSDALNGHVNQSNKLMTIFYQLKIELQAQLMIQRQMDAKLKSSDAKCKSIEEQFRKEQKQASDMRSALEAITSDRKSIFQENQRLKREFKEARAAYNRLVNRKSMTNGSAEVMNTELSDKSPILGRQQSFENSIANNSNRVVDSNKLQKKSPISKLFNAHLKENSESCGVLSSENSIDISLNIHPELKMNISDSFVGCVVKNRAVVLPVTSGRDTSISFQPDYLTEQHQHDTRYNSSVRSSQASCSSQTTFQNECNDIVLSPAQLISNAVDIAGNDSSQMADINEPIWRNSSYHSTIPQISSFGASHASSQPIISMIPPTQDVSTVNNNVVLLNNNNAYLDKNLPLLDSTANSIDKAIFCTALPPLSNRNNSLGMDFLCCENNARDNISQLDPVPQVHDNMPCLHQIGPNTFATILQSQNQPSSLLLNATLPEFSSNFSCFESSVQILPHSNLHPIPVGIESIPAVDLRLDSTINYCTSANNVHSAIMSAYSQPGQNHSSLL